jgi:ATP-dependent Clp protease adaptor protein ClpS
MTETAPVLTPVDATDTEDRKAIPWLVVILNDEINLMNYVVLALMRVLGLGKEAATKHMLEIHKSGESVVWSGEKEKAEAYVQEFLGWKLNAQLRPSS